MSLAGVVVVTSATVLWLFLLPVTLSGEGANPYFGIVTFLVLPAAFFAGLILIPAGILLQLRARKRRGLDAEVHPPLGWHRPDVRRLVLFIALATLANLAIGSQFTYRAVTYMDSAGFCGQACHRVMQPEFVAFQDSPHARVECVECHIGPGADHWVRSKFGGVGQMFGVAFNTYPRPIPAPVPDLRPARETCETCHWAQKGASDRLRVFHKYSAEPANALTRTVLLMRIGRAGGAGIRGAHLGEGIAIRYAYADEKRQDIPWVEYRAPGRSTVYVRSGANSAESERLPMRDMDCIDCHNRTGHAFESVEQAVDRTLRAGGISSQLPFVKAQALEILKTASASGQIPALLDAYYRDKHPQVYLQRRPEIQAAARSLAALHRHNVFPQMNVTWGTYPNHIGHADSPGCFRCHDDQHSSPDGRRITQDCNSCHSLLALEEARPKILADLGVE
ncbi:MAG: cytochrome C [Acidobacteria bacterium]|nr:cytochrome C [Acidobacteriota bacterium]